MKAVSSRFLFLRHSCLMPSFRWPQKVRKDFYFIPSSQGEYFCYERGDKPPQLENKVNFFLYVLLHIFT